MSNGLHPFTPNDQAERYRALDAKRSILVQAPAGSGKTTLLTQRFLRLLTTVDDPGHIVAITFTNAAAAEMRNRIIEALRKAEDNPEAGSSYEFTDLNAVRPEDLMPVLAHRAIEHCRNLKWSLDNLPAQLRISTIDSFCRELALQQPLLSGFGGALNIAQPPDVLYRLAARRTLESMDAAEAVLGEAIADLLWWRDNNWSDLEEQLVGMLADRDRWMHAFLLDSAPDWESLRSKLERPFTPVSYTDDEWRIVRASFTLLRYAAAQLKVVFAENALVDFIEVAQIAQAVLREPDGSPSDAAIPVADGIHHLLVDEFQDTSRRQHQLLASLVAAWPDRSRRTCFVVGDPMQSIYFFRNAEAEIFLRVRDLGLEIPGAPPFRFDFVQLTSNFRTAPRVVADLNGKFAKIFAKNDGSNIAFSAAVPDRKKHSPLDPSLSLHLAFVPHIAPFKAAPPEAKLARRQAQQLQIEQIVSLIQSHKRGIDQGKETPKPENGRYRIAILARVKNSLIPIAQALRDAEIPFRAIELEGLVDRPEILDALALARALLNPQDRVAWLGVLRAPWCGLSLADLASIAEAHGQTATPIPDLLAERSHLLSPQGRPAAERVLRAIAAAPTLRAAQPSASLGTWLQQVWLLLGGDATADATARANVDLLFARLDQLPQADSDLLGPALDAALKDLKALPDPDANSDFGVQLMTIHKSKGLEFEVVIVPDLQLEDRKTKPKMLSWLERGIPPDADSIDGELTEFLVAPIQSKGSDKGSAKECVDLARRSREQQETRRILYVAATRARDQLHLFARPEYKMEKDGSLALAEPSNSLLATAWPALEDEVRQRFAEWKTQPSAGDDSEPGELTALAAQAEGNLLQMPSPPKPTRLRRLPPDFVPGAGTLLDVERLLSVDSVHDGAPLYARHEGGLASRALGTAVHALFQQLARLRATCDWPTARAALEQFAPRILADMRAAGVDLAHAESLAADAMRLALDASTDRNAAWILSPHPGAASEVRWTGVLDGVINSVQIDRLFQAGATPQSEGEGVWWIVDYKTAHLPATQPDAAPDLAALRPLYARQLEIYARVLRNLHGADATVRAALYYPRMTALDWWQL